MRDIYREITSEKCEDCERTTYFTLDQLGKEFDGLVTIHNRAVTYDGNWVCKCGYTNSSVGACRI